MAKESELIRRCMDLIERSEKTQSVTHTSFLTPAEQYEISEWLNYTGISNTYFEGGYSGSERTALFVLPSWCDMTSLDISEYMSAVKITAGFGMPGHRDYLGSILGLGIKREWIGDILIDKNIAFVLCLKPSDELIISTLDHVSRYGVKADHADFSSIVAPKKSVKSLYFTVQSMRFDAIVGSLFGLSRSHAVKLIAAGAASLNYSVCFKNDAPVKDGDIITVRGLGKAKLIGQTGQSRKGRTFLSAERYL